MRTLLAAMCLTASALTHAGDVASTASPLPFKPRTYALVSALGEQFSAVTEVMSTGSHLPPYRRRSLDASGNLLNLLVLRQLEQQVGAMAPDSKRVFISFPESKIPRAPPNRRAQATFDAVVAELQSHPERANWDRILLVTPAYRAQDKDGMGAKLQGMGLFIEPMCQSNVDSCANNTAPLSGPMAERPDGSMEAANGYIAPYFYITIWELDAATFSVLEKLEVFEHHRMLGDDNRPGAVLETVDRTRLATQVSKLVGTSIRDALRQTELAGHVEARLLSDAPNPAPKPPAAN